MLSCRLLVQQYAARHISLECSGSLRTAAPLLKRSRDRVANDGNVQVKAQGQLFCQAWNSSSVSRHGPTRWMKTETVATQDPFSRKVHCRSLSSTPSAQREVRLQHILLSKDQTELFNQLQNDLEGGASFEELAKQHSSCPSAESGGELGWVSQSMGMHPSLAEAIFSIPRGEAATVEAADGLHLFKVVEERDAQTVQIMTVDALEQLLKEKSDDTQFIDVREEHEHKIARLPHFQLLPLSRFQEWGPTVTTKFDPEKQTVCICHAGVRSLQVANLLLGAGFKNVHNVSGGIEAYSCFIDPSVPRY